MDTNTLKGWLTKEYKMTEKPMENAPDAPEKGGLPTPSFSADSSGQSTSGGNAVDVEVLVKRLDDQDKRLKEFERREQSVKDKRLGEHEKRIMELEQMGGLLKQHGGDVQKAVRDMRLLEAEERLLATNPEPQKPSPQVLPGREQLVEEYDAKITNYLTKRGFAKEDIREATAGMATKTFKDVEEAMIEAAAMADTWRENKVKQDAPVSAGGMAMPKGGAVNRDLTEQYIKEFAAAYGNPAQARAVRDKYKNLGVDVGSIGWGAKGVRNAQGE
jgi:hypothetical protein